MKQALTQCVIESLKPTGQRYIIWDRRLTGLGVVVHPSGRLVYVYQYGPRGRQRRIRVGVHPLMTLPQARRKVITLAGKWMEGSDPLDQKREAQRAPTFSAWASEYLAGVRLRKKRPREDIRYLRIAGEAFGTKQLDQVAIEDISRVFERIAGRGHRTEANRWLASVRACLQSAWRAGRISDNPAMRIKPLPENPPRDRTLSADELKRLLDYVASVPDCYVRIAFRILIETGARSSKVLRARWEDIDFGNRTWRIPSPKAGRPQVVPLPGSTVHALRALPRNGTYVVRGRNPERPRHDLKHWWATALKRIGAPNLHIHDLRRTLGLDIAKRAGIWMASRALRHGDIRVADRHYAPLAMDDLRAILDARAHDLPQSIDPEKRPHDRH